MAEKQVYAPFKCPVRMPNGLQWVDDELYVIDQLTDDVFILDDTGVVLRVITTETVNGSGITYGDGAIWTACNSNTGASARPQRPSDHNTANIRKVDPVTGETIDFFPTPDGGGVHGLEWDAGNIWVTETTSKKLALMDGKTYQILLEIPCDLNVLHGLATDGDGIWCADRADKIVVKYEKSTGKEMERVELPEKGPDPHGLSIKDGVLWYSDADFPVAEGMRGYPEIGMVVD